MYSDEYNNEEINENYENESQEVSYDNNGSNKTKLLIVIAGIVLVIIIIIFLVLKNNNNGPVTPVVPNLIISSEKENLSINNNIQLIANVTNFQNAIVTWTSSNPEVATVDQMGIVKGIDYGTSFITATYLHTDGMPYTVSCEVTVATGNPNVPITNVRFQEGEIMISVGNEYSLPIIIEPSDGYITDVNYTSSNNAVVTVDNEGRIKSLSPGKSIISLDFNGQYKDEINVNVVNENVFTQVFIPVTNIEFADKLLKLKVDETKQLNYQVSPQDALTSYLKWESSNESVATVSNGIITAIAPGTADITLTSLEGVSAIMTVEVEKNFIPVTGITTTFPSLDLTVGLTSQIVVNVTPADATNKRIIYSSSNPSIASVDANGIVTANSEGAAVITITADGIKEGSNAVTTTIVVNVSKSSSSGGSSGSGSSCKSGLSASPSYVDLKEDGTATINISFKEDGDKVVRCYSSNTNYVKIPGRTENSCTVKGVKEGKATVTIVSEKNMCVSVTVKVGNYLSVNSSYSVGVGKYVTVKPSYSGNMRVTSCSIADTSIAKAHSTSGDCSVLGVKAGSTTLTITATDTSGASKNVTTTIKVK